MAYNTYTFILPRYLTVLYIVSQHSCSYSILVVSWNGFDPPMKYNIIIICRSAKCTIMEKALLCCICMYDDYADIIITSS